MQNNFNIEDVRNTIIDAINEKKSFKELREQLPGVRKPRLLALIFDIMEQLGIEKSNHPFPDAMERPRIKRKALTVEETSFFDATC